MAIIYSYQENNELRLSDMLVGTATTLHDGKVRKVTKNFTLGELKTFINGGDLILTNGGTSGPATLTDNILNIPVYQGAITLTTTGTSGSATLIGNTLNIPNYTTPTPTLQSVTTEGNTTTLDIFANTFQTNTGYGLLDDGTVIGETFQFPSTSSYLNYLGVGFNTWTLPDASGTIALTSDIPVVTTPTLQQVTTAGSTTTDAVTLGTTTIKQSTGTNVAIFKDNTNANVGTVDEFGRLNFIGDYHTFDNGTATIVAGYYRANLYGSGFVSVGDGYHFIVSSNTGAIDGFKSKGTIEYEADYSANYGNRTLVDKEYVQNAISSSGGGLKHGTASGTDTYTVTITGVTSYADGDAYLIRFTNGNTTSATLNINGLGAIALYRNNDGPLIGGDVLANGEMLCVYNSTSSIFQCIGVAPNTLLAYVTNAETTTITRGQPVYVSGGVGDRVKVKLAYNTADLTSAQTIGIVSTASIAANQKGIIIVQGQLDNLSLFPTSTWADGDYIYLGATPGTITNVKPVAPNHLVYLGYVTTASNGNAGRMYVKVQNGYELQELHNVYINPATLANNDGVFYNSSTSLWENKTIASALGYTPLSAAITSLNSLTGASQTLTTGISGADFAISSTGSTHTFNLPTASETNRGALSSSDWSDFSNVDYAVVSSFRLTYNY